MRRSAGLARPASLWLCPATSPANPGGEFAEDAGGNSEGVPRRRKTFSQRAPQLAAAAGDDRYGWTVPGHGSAHPETGQTTAAVGDPNRESLGFRDDAPSPAELSGEILMPTGLEARRKKATPQSPSRTAKKGAARGVRE